jgi:hypothetical protein
MPGGDLIIVAAVYDRRSRQRLFKIRHPEQAKLVLALSKDL